MNFNPAGAPASCDVRILLLRPEQPRNVGAVVRAAANFGAESVCIVGARSWGEEEERQARIASARAWDVIGGVRHFETLAEAATGCNVLAGTSGRPRRHAGEPVEPAAFFSSDNPGYAGLVGVVFGPESQGLSADDLSRCHVWLRIPTRNAFPSLNLAQAVLLVLYEASRGRNEAPAAGDAPGLPDAVPAASADVAAQEAFLARLEGCLDDSGSMAGLQSERTLGRLRRLLQRAGPEAGDLAMLNNLITALRKRP